MQFVMPQLGLTMEEGTIAAWLVAVGDQVLFSPEDRYEVEVRGDDYIILRERDVHAVAAERLSEGSTGLYL